MGARDCCGAGANSSKQVERGYSLGIEDYRNDLDVRGIIELAKADDAEVHALDERLRELLIGDRYAGLGERARQCLLGLRLSAQCGSPIFWRILRREKLLL